MPNNNRSRGSRGKRLKTKHAERETHRPAQQQALRLQEAITKRFRRNPLWCEEPDSAQAPGASSSTTLPADEQEQTTPSGVIPVSIDSDSDQALSPSEEGSPFTPPPCIPCREYNCASVKEPDPKVKSLGPTTDSSYDGYAINEWTTRPNGTNGL